MNCRLLILSATHKGRTYELTEDKYTVGRIKQRDICIPDPTVSSYHCEFEKTGETYTIKDCDSTNGTRVNNIPLKEKQVLHGGDLIFVGAVEILFDSSDRINKTSTVEQTGIDLKKQDLTKTRILVMPNASPFDKIRRKQEQLLKKINTWGLIFLTIMILLLLAYLLKIMLR